MEGSQSDLRGYFGYFVLFSVVEKSRETENWAHRLSQIRLLWTENRTPDGMASGQKVFCILVALILT